MENVRSTRCSTALWIAILMLFLPLTLFAQPGDVLNELDDLLDYSSCTSWPIPNEVLSISIDHYTGDPDTIVKIENLSGYAVLGKTPPDKYYQFAGSNATCFVSTSNEIEITFESPAGITIGVSRLSFVIRNPSSLSGGKVIPHLDGPQPEQNIVGTLSTFTFPTECTIKYDTIKITAPNHNYTSDGFFTLDDLKIEDLGARISPYPAEVCSGDDLELNGIVLYGSSPYGTPSWSGPVTPINPNKVTFNSTNLGSNAVSYTISDDDGCSVTANLNVNVKAKPSVSTIEGGATEVCVGKDTPAFTNATSGGTWSIVNGTGTASINTSGVVTGGSAGDVTVRYTVESNGCFNSATANLTVKALPSVNPIANGATEVCVGAQTPAFTNATSGGTWSIVNGTGTASINISGVVTGGSAGDVTVRYTVESNGCNNSATANLTVKALPSVNPITNGATEVCVGAQTPAFTNATTGGTWSIVNGTGTASINTSGVVTGGSAGDVTVRYTVESNGCENSATANLTVNDSPDVTIGEYGPYCRDGGIVTITGDPPGTAGSWTEITNILDDNGDGTADFNPGNVTGASQVCQYSYTENGCTGTGQVEILIEDNCPELIAVMDLSGSMSWDYNGNHPVPDNLQRIEYAKTALQAYTDLVVSNFNNRAWFGLVGFKSTPGVYPYDCNAYPYYGQEVLHEGNLLTANTAIENLETGSMTPLLKGMDVAKNRYQSTGPKSMILLSDGVHNCPNTINNNGTDVTLPAGIKIYTIGFGQSTNVDLDLLEYIGTETGGGFYDLTNFYGYDPTDPGPKFADPTAASNGDAWDAGSALDLAYSHVLTGMGLSYISEPIGVINKDEIKEYPVPVSRFDSKVCFFVSWTSSERNYLDVSVRTSNNESLPATHPDIRYIHREKYSIITVSGTYLLKDGVVGSNPWTLTLDATGTSSDEKFQYFVMNQPKQLKFNTWLDKDWYYTGDPMKIHLELVLGNERIRNLDKAVIYGTGPLLGYGNILAAQKITSSMIRDFKQQELEHINRRSTELAREQNLDPEQTEAYIRKNELAYSDMSSNLVLRTKMLGSKNLDILNKRIKVKGLDFRDDGIEGDATAGDGIYTAQIDKLKQEGSYKLDIGVEERISGELVTREDQLTAFIRVNTLLKYYVKKVSKIDTLISGKTAYIITLNLKDRKGNVPHPNSLKNINITVNNGELSGPLTAHPNGSFTQSVILDENVNPRNVKLTMSIGEETGEDYLRNRCFLWNFLCRKFCSGKK